MTTEGQDNPQVFPSMYFKEGGDEGLHVKGGLELRDYFAAKAMQSLVLHPWYTQDDKPYDRIAPAMAEDAYRLADAMLKARKEGV